MIEKQVCTKCHNEKLLSEFYYRRKNNRSETRCKECCKEESKKQYKGRNHATNNQYMCIPEQPGTYKNEFQKQETFEILYKLGWSYNEEKNLWYKGIKDKDGIWNFPAGWVKINPELRHCNHCNTDKSLDDFYHNKNPNAHQKYRQDDE